MESQAIAGPFGLVVVDEAHHAVAPSWREVLERLGAFEPKSGTRCVGFSATLARGDGIGLGSVWQEVAYAVSLTRLIKRGHLTDVRGVQVTVDKLDLTDVRRSGGDYAASALGAAMVESDAATTVAKAYVEHAQDRQGVVFTPTVGAAEDVLEALSTVNIPAAIVTGTTPREDRLSIYQDYREGRTQVLVNCMVLTEGFDAPWASCAVIARPTQSAPLYTQMVGRVLRPWTGKTDALVLDVVGATKAHKLATLVDLAPGTVTVVRPDQSLAEAAEEAELAAITDQIERERYAEQSRLTAKDVDLFAQSKSVWLRTQAGVWFIPVYNGDFFLWPSAAPGLWDACFASNPVQGAKPLPWERRHVGCSFELAMTWAQVESEESDSTISMRDASWRRRGGKASEAQVGFLKGLGYTGSLDDLSKRDASDAISVIKASKRFDRYYRRDVLV